MHDLPYLRLDLSDFSLTPRDGISDWRSLEATAFDPEPNDHGQHENSDRVVDNHMERRLHAGIAKDNYAYKTVIAANGLESLARVKGRFFNAGACARGLPEFCPTADHERSWEGTERHSEISQVLATLMKCVT